MMFVPEGHIQLLYVRQACIDFADERFPPRSIDEKDKTFQIMEADPRAVLYSELMLKRFIEAFCEEFFVFQYPNILLRAPIELYIAERIYDGPCPLEISEAEEAIKFMRSNELSFLSDEMRIVDDFSDEAKHWIEVFGLESFARDVALLKGSVLCWRSNLSLEELPKVLKKFQDEEYWLGIHPNFPLKDEESIDEVRDNSLFHAYSCYRQRYPEGKKSAKATWAEVEKTVGYSRRTILRAEKKFGNTEVGNITD